MAYRKFDDPAKSVSGDARKLYPVFTNEALRRALQSVTNRIVYGGGAGTATSTLHYGSGTGATGGLKIGNILTAVINGRWGTISAQAELNFPSGTQSNATYVKYLVSSGFGSSGTVTAGNEGTSATKARLPDCPDGHVALGYMEFYTNSASNGWPRGGKTNDTPGKCTGTGGTGGTVNDWEDLIHMPLDES